jgi:hypothetical protein
LAVIDELIIKPQRLINRLYCVFCVDKIEFLNSVIVELQRKNVALEARLQIMESSTIMSDSTTESFLKWVPNHYYCNVSNTFKSVLEWKQAIQFTKCIVKLNHDTNKCRHVQVNISHREKRLNHSRHLFRSVFASNLRASDLLWSRVHGVHSELSVASTSSLISHSMDPVTKQSNSTLKVRQTRDFYAHWYQMTVTEYRISDASDK